MDEILEKYAAHCRALAEDPPEANWNALLTSFAFELAAYDADRAPDLAAARLRSEGR